MPDVKDVLEFAGVEVLQDAVDDLYLQLQQLSEQRDKLRTALAHIQEMAAEDLRVERVFVCHSFLSQIEATARQALNSEAGRQLENAGADAPHSSPA